MNGIFTDIFVHSSEFVFVSSTVSIDCCMHVWRKSKIISFLRAPHHTSLSKLFEKD